jgi:hypothetical protein
MNKYMPAEKTAYTEKRASERCSCKAPIRVTRFNGEHWSEARTLNHSMEGMCVQSRVQFKPKTAISIRVEHDASNGSCNCALKGLPATALGKIKWCREASDVTSYFYEIGVRYYLPDY